MEKPMVRALFGLGIIAGCLSVLQGIAANAVDAPPLPPRRPGLRIDYRTTGVLPGGGPDEKAVTVLQRITLDDSGSHLLYEESNEGGKETKRVILRTDGPKPIIYEVFEGKKYREYPGDLNEVQKERRIAEENEILAANHLPKNERQAYYKENTHLRPNGKPEVEVSREPGEKVLGFDCEKVLVTENGRAIIQGLVTKSAIGAGSPFQLYRRLGAFSDEVLQKVEGIEGILLRGRITVVTALRANELDVEAKQIERVDLDPGLFEVAGLTKVEDASKNAACAFCGKKIADPKRASGKLFLNGDWIYFCCEECAQKYREARLKDEQLKK